MFILGVIAAVAIAGLAAPVVKRLLENHWTEIQHWLNNTAVDAVERTFGYNARKAIQKAINKTSRMINKHLLVNRADVYFKENPLSTHYHKVTLETEGDVHSFDSDFIKVVDEKGALYQDMEYRN